MHGSGLRQKNGTINEPPPPNAWRILDKKINQPNNISDGKTIVVRTDDPNANKTNSSASGEVVELVNLAHKVNIAERLKRQKEKEAKISTEEDILKKMLGVGQNKSVQMDSKTVQYPNHTQKVDLNTLFGKANLNELSDILPSPSSLPKPPPAWHQRSTPNTPNTEQTTFLPPQFQQQQQQQHQPQQWQFPLHQQQQQQQQPLLQPQFHNNHPMNAPLMQPFFPHPRPNMQLPLSQYSMMPFTAPSQRPHLPPQMFQHPEMVFYGNQNFQMPMMTQGSHMMTGPPPFMNASHQMRMSTPHVVDFDGPPNRTGPPPVLHHSPEGPQKLKTKSGTASAFIPLQAARKGIKGKSSVNNIQTANDSAKNDSNLTEANDKTLEIVQVFCYAIFFFERFVLTFNKLIGDLFYYIRML